MIEQQPAARRVRLFIALELPDEWRHALAELQRRQERAAPAHFRWVKPGLMHLTLVFLGYQQAELLPQLADLVQHAAAETATFRMRLGRVGSFGGQHAPRVLWVEALQPEGRLQRLRQALERELQAAGIAFDQKPLVAHITLGRARDHAAAHPRVLSPTVDAPTHRVERVVLMQSRLSPRGPSYEVLASAPLRNRQREV